MKLKNILIEEDVSAFNDSRHITCELDWRANGCYFSENKFIIHQGKHYHDIRVPLLNVNFSNKDIIDLLTHALNYNNCLECVEQIIDVYIQKVTEKMSDDMCVIRNVIVNPLLNQNILEKLKMNNFKIFKTRLIPNNKIFLLPEPRFLGGICKKQIKLPNYFSNLKPVNLEGAFIVNDFLIHSIIIN